jgi:hypothetical protein
MIVVDFPLSARAMHHDHGKYAGAWRHDAPQTHDLSPPVRPSPGRNPADEPTRLPWRTHLHMADRIQTRRRPYRNKTPTYRAAIMRGGPLEILSIQEARAALSNGPHHLAILVPR